MTARDKILLDALKKIAAGRFQNRNGNMQRMSRDDCFETARRAIVEYDAAPKE